MEVWKSGRLKPVNSCIPSKRIGTFLVIDRNSSSYNWHEDGIVSLAIHPEVSIPGFAWLP